MNTLPSDIIIFEIFPKLELSEIITLTTIYPSLIGATKEFIIQIGKKFGFENVNTSRDVLANLHFKKEFREIFNMIKYELPVLLHLFTMEYYHPDQYISLLELENRFHPKIEELYTVFISDFEENFEIIFGERFIKLSIVKYMKENPPFCGSQNHTIDFRLFQKSIDLMLDTYLTSRYIAAPHVSLKSELNRKIFFVITPPRYRPVYSVK